MQNALWAVTANTVFYLAKAAWEKYFLMDSAKDAFGTAVWKVLGVPESDVFRTAEGGQAIFFAGGSVGMRPAGHPAWQISQAEYDFCNAVFRSIENNLRKGVE